MSCLTVIRYMDVRINLLMPFITEKARIVMLNQPTEVLSSY